MLMNLFKFQGGVKPPSNKTQSVGLPITRAPMPSRLVVPLHQSIGGTPRPVVQAGDKVLKGQLIGEADGWISAAIHAPTSGTVVEVAMHVQPHPSGLGALCVSSNRTARTNGSHINRSTTPLLRPKPCANTCSAPALSASGAPSSRHTAS